MNAQCLNDINLISNLHIEELLNGITQDNICDTYNINDTSDTNHCKNCESSDLKEDYTKGIIVCHNCGQVNDSIIDNRIEYKNYNKSQNNISGSIVHNKLLPQSSLGTTVNLNGRLKRLHIWNAIPYKERSNKLMFTKIHNVCMAHNIYRKIEDDAKILCKTVSETIHKSGKNKGKPIITRGYNREGIVASCLFIACRRNNETHSTKEIARYFNIDERDVNKGLRSLLSIMNDDTMIKDIGTSKVGHFIKRKCDELEIKNKYTEVAIIIGNNIDRLNIASNHTTFSLAAASILLMAHIYGLKHITKKRLSLSFHNLSDVTIGKTYKQIKDYKSVLIDNKKVSDIIIDINNKKQQNIVPRVVWEQMIRFNIDTSNYTLEEQKEE